MVPYSNFFYFYILTLAVIPAIILGLSGKSIKWYGSLITVIMLGLIYSNSRSELEFLIGFYFFELILVYLYLFLSKGCTRRWLLWLFVFASIVPLIITKFGAMFNLSRVGFLGISYLTFKVTQIILQIYDGHIKSINIIDFSYFLLFFPTISSGPIDRSKRFIENINLKFSRKEYAEILGDGLWKTITGIGYKFIIAYYINENWLKKIPARHPTFLSSIKYMYSYSFYLFFDFAGYSLIAIGISYILGVKTPENFNMPFISKDIKEFWNRWHMTLSFWFRDFIYNRFVMASIRKKRFKSKYTASYIGYFITMGVMGLWHGTELHYIVYGLYHAMLIVGTDIYQRKKFYKKHREKLLYKSASVVVTFNLICFGFLIFSGYLFK